MSRHPFEICLWFDTQAEEAARFYTSVFKDGRIGKIKRYGKEGFEYHRKPEGSVMTVEFFVNGQKFIALNGGPEFKFNEAIALMVLCDTQQEVDHYWEGLTAGGGQEVQCGWLKDKFGLAWQVIPTQFQKLVEGPDAAGAQRVMQAMFTMKKFDIAALERAYQGR